MACARCIFERRLSSITKDSGCCLTLSGLKKEPRNGQEVHSWLEVIAQCKGSRFEPLSPDAFEEMMVDGMKRDAVEAGTGFRFTNGKDATTVCIPQYREAFLRLVSGAEGLRYGGRGSWGDDKAAVLCDALLWAHTNGATTQATYLGLLGNRLTDASAARLVAVLSAGAAPRLETLCLVGNALTDAGKQTMKVACEARGVDVEL